MEDRNEEAIFDAAIELKDPTERARFVAQACGGDQKLLADVESLLRSHDSHSLLDAPLLDSVAVENQPPVAEGPGTVIGRYKLLEKIGEGGMAVVYMAEQEQPIRRKVALKIIKLGMDTRQVIARFEVERQALAMMDHPSIAKVLDAGATGTGRPYFVMELVQGISITEYCDKNNLSTKDRLALFIQVCNAVQHAHQKGIIHRDIKPSNVMVTHHDGKPVPKVIDFGIAKATNQRLTEKTLFTRYAHLIGTPAYMSPEQAELSDLDIDTRSDIYSLGVLLYELLTGTTPFSEEELRKAGYIEMQRIIREQEPAKPSTRLSTLGDTLTNIARCRNSSPDLLTRALRGDLDWIVMKSLEKDRARRYETTNSLAEDIRRHLDCEPVSARPPTSWYRGKKLLQRHGRLVGLLAVVATTLVTATVVSTSLYVRMRRAIHTASTLQNQVDVDHKLSAAQKLYNQGRHLAALEELEGAFQERDLGSKAHLFHAQLLIELKRGPEAEAELLPLTQADREIAATAHYLLARANIGQDKVKAAEHEALATSMLPDTAEAYVLRAITAPTQDEALEWLNRAIALDASYYPAHKARALIYYSRMEDEKAVEDVAALIVLRPKGYLGYALRAVQRREAGRLEEALIDHERAISLCEDAAELAEVHEHRYVTHVRRRDYASALQDARRLVDLSPQSADYRMCTAICLVATEDYAGAQREYRSIVQTSYSWDRSARSWLALHVLDALKAGWTFRIPPEIADKAPFAMVRRTMDCYNALVRNAVRIPVRNRGFIAFSWSPDSRRLLCGWGGVFGAMGRTIRDAVPGLFAGPSVKIIDIESGDQRLLTSNNQWFPAWSPDGKRIAFSDKDGNLCLVPPEGGLPRIVAQGIAPQWSRDSQHLYFRKSFGGSELYSIDIRNPDPRLIEAVRLPGWFVPCEEQGWMAFGTPADMSIVDMTSGSTLYRCPSPWPLFVWQLQRSPSGKELFFASWWSYKQVGPIVLDTETKELYQVLDYPVDQILWSPDGSKVAIGASREIWILNADPNLLISQRLGSRIPGGDLIAHEVAKLSRAIAVDPLYPENYLERAVAYMSSGRYADVESDLRQFDAVVTSDDHHIGYELFWWLKECYANGMHDGAALLTPYAERFMERFPAEVPSYKPLVVEMAEQHEREGRTELAARWRAKLQAFESREN
ncbi:MAG: protein kinase [Sedimentisphaerales bacterium]|nr:protein kinase [Sedimentisphaerales bacterium]